MLASIRKASESHSLCFVPDWKRLLVQRGTLPCWDSDTCSWLFFTYWFCLLALSDHWIHTSQHYLTTPWLPFCNHLLSAPGCALGLGSCAGVVLCVQGNWGGGMRIWALIRKGRCFRSETAGMIWLHKNPVKFPWEILLLTIADILPHPKSAIPKILVLLLSKKTTSSDLRSQLELETCRMTTQIPL